MELSMSSRQSKEVKVTFAVTVGNTGISREREKRYMSNSLYICNDNIFNIQEISNKFTTSQMLGRCQMSKK